jgi:hypothetical protein
MLTTSVSFLLTGTLVAIAAAWLSSRPHPLVQVLGLSLAVLIVSFCGFVAFALMADDVDAPLTSVAVFSLLAFSAIGTASGINAFRGLKARADSTRLVRR